MSVTTPDPLETREFWNLMMDFHRAPLATLATLETPAHRALRNYLRPFLKPPGPPASETQPTPTPRPVRVGPDGRLYEMSGEPIDHPGIDPAGVLEGLADEAAGRVRPLDEVLGRVRPTQPQPREVRREFVAADGRPCVVAIEGSNLEIIFQTHIVVDAPELARLILEVAEEATAPDAPRCPYCGGVAAAAPWDSGGYVGVCVAPACVARGPSRPTGVEAVAAFAGPGKGEG